MSKPLTNVGASVRARLLALARQANQPFELFLTRFVLERLLYRLGRSRYADDFVLKGAMLLTTWLPHWARGTRDLDLLGFGDASEDRMLTVFRQVLVADEKDGIVFQVDDLRVDRVREEMKYGGVRLRTTADLGGAKVVVIVDVGFGDSVEPGLETLRYPVLLDFSAPTLRAYARETVVAEKFQAMVALGRANSRMKDFYDVWALSRLGTMTEERLARAIAATFARRETPVPGEAPDALTDAFAEDPAKQRQWNVFVADLPDAPRDLRDVVRDLAAFVLPPARIARAEQNVSGERRGDVGSGPER